MRLRGIDAKGALVTPASSIATRTSCTPADRAREIRDAPGRATYAEIAKAGGGIALHGASDARGLQRAAARAPRGA
jgi:hypothetical protein